MSTQYIAAASVHTGGWINWTDGRVKGATVTMSPRDGTYLIAFLALFVRVAGNAFWDILSCVVFLFRSRTTAEDALFHQQQLLLRCGTSDVGVAWHFWSLGWRWRRHVTQPWLRTLPILLTAVAHIVLFGVAGVFVSRVAETRAEVLLVPSTCGLWADRYAFGNGDPSSIVGDAFEAELQSQLATSGAYASLCYRFNDTPPSEACNAYGRSLLTWSLDAGATCPFAADMCVDGVSVLLDSGLIDSHLHFGINAESKYRIQYRQTLQCAPLTTEGFTFSTLNLSDPRIPPGMIFPEPDDYNTPAGSAFTGFLYGNAFGYNSTSNATYVFNNNTFGDAAANVDEMAYLFK